jgi:integrase
MRYKLADGEWDRLSTKTNDLDEAKAAARKAYEWEEKKQLDGIPSSKKTLEYFAELYVANLQKAINSGKQVGTFSGYIKVVEKYINPIIGHVKIGSVGAETIKTYEATRDDMWQGAISKSSVNTHNVVLRGILREAVERRFIKSSDIPLLTVKGKGQPTESRPPFYADEIELMMERFPDWADEVDDAAKYNRILLSLYVQFLAATGVRPGQEALAVKWKHISDGVAKASDVQQTIPSSPVVWDAFYHPDTYIERNEQDEFIDYKRIIITDGKLHNRSDQPSARPVIARGEISRILNDIAWHTRRKDPDDYLFCSALGGRLKSDMAPLFSKFLNHCGLLYAPDGRRRSLYSLRHYYTNEMIRKNSIPLIVIAQNMGTSVEMLEKYYTSNLVEEYAEHFAR